MPSPAESSGAESARTKARERSSEPLHPLVSAALEPGTPSLEARLQRIAAQSSGARRYTILGDVAEGGMGKILRAWDEGLQREVAMKLVPLRPASGSSEEQEADHEQRLARFIEEARITGQLDHPGIVPVYEVGVDEQGAAFFTMPLVRGQNLKKIFELVHRGQEGWTLHRALGVMHTVCLTLAFAHSRGVVHRDLKPENIMVGPFGEAYVMDWGLALLLGRSAREGIVGTPAYMSPEQAAARQGEVGPRSDVYSLGAILYELFTRRMPHELSLEVERPGRRPFQRVIASPPRPLRSIAARVPRELAAICEKAMARSPERRYQSALALAEDLAAWLEGRVVGAHQTTVWERFRKWRARNRGLTLATDALAALSVTSVLAFLLQQRLWLGEVEAKHRQALLSGYAASLSSADLGLRAHETSEAKRRLRSCERELRGWEWQHLALRADASVRVLRGHEQAVRSVTVQPDGARIATGSDDGTVRLWDAGSGELEATAAGHGDVVAAVTFAPDGLRLASGSHDETVRIWRAGTGKLERTIEEHGADVLALAFSGDGAQLASGDAAGVIVVSAVETGATFAALAGDPMDGVAALDFDPRSGCIAAAYRSGLVRCWDPSTEECTRKERVCDHTLQALEIDPAGRRLAVASEGSVFVLDARTLERELAIDHGSKVNAIAFDRRGERLATCGYDNVVRVWTWRSSGPDGALAAILLAEFDGHDDDVNAVAFFPDGQRLLSGAEDASARIWDLERPAVTVLAGHAGWVDSIAFSPDGTRLVSGSHDSTLRIWDARSGAELERVRSGGIVDCVAWSARDSIAFACGDPALRVAQASAPGSWRTLEPGRGFAKTIAFDRDGARLFERSSEGLAGIQAVASGARLASVETGDDSTFSLAVHPALDRLATGSREGVVRIWDARTGALRATYRDGSAGITALAYSPDGETLAAGRLNGSIVLFSTRTGASERELDGHESLVSCLAFSPDGTRLVSGSYDKHLRLWSRSSGEALLVLHAHAEAVTAVAFDPAGETLASASKDETIRLWRTSPDVQLER